MIGALFAPLSQCSRGGKENAALPPPKAGMQKIFPRNDAQTDYDYGAKHLDDLALRGDVTLVAFAWPLIFAFLGLRWRRQRYGWLLCIAEILLGAGTVWFIYALSDFGDRLWGAWLVIALTSAYTLAAVVDLCASWRGRSRRSGGP